MSIVYDINIQGLTVGTKYDSDNEAAFYKSGNPNLQVDSSHGDHIKCVTHPTQSGRKALELFVQKSPNSFSQELHKGRAEIVSPYDLGPSDHYLGCRIMFPSDFPTGARELIFIQGGNYGSSSLHPNISCSLNNDVISFEGGYDMPIKRDRWYAIEYRIKMNPDSASGKFQLWVDGALKVDKTQKTCYSASEGGDNIYVWKLGMYAYNWRYAPDVAPDSYHYFVDHLKLATTRAEVVYSASPGTSLLAPTVAMTTPAKGSQLTVGKRTVLKASATIATGAITKVEFYSPVNPTSIIGTATSPTNGQYEVSYAFTSPGTKEIVAKAYGSNGTTTQSSAFTYNAVTSDVTPPTVSMQPIQILVGEAIRLVASANDDAKVSKIEFFGTNAAGDISSGAKPLTTETVAPYQGRYAFTSAGTKHVVAVATDTTANKTKSAPISFKVYQ